MTAEQQLVQQIQQALSSPQLEKNGALEDLALQFTELCEAANNRLLRCCDYIDKGMRSEAVNEAHNSPDLLELANVLAFDGARKWRNLCGDLEMSIFTPLDETLVAKLRQAVARESDMEPLLKEYRRYVYQGDHRNCILLLRQIREADPENPSWKTNLQPLEEEEMPSLVRNAEEALMDNDHVRLKVLYDDFSSPQRVVMPPAELMERIRRELMSERAEDLKLDGMILVKKMRSAIDAVDCALTESIIPKMEALASDDAFLFKPEGWDSALADAKELLSVQKHRRERQADFLKAADDMQQLLARGGFTEMELRHEWERLLSWEMPVSDMLRRQVEERLAEMKAVKHRKMMAVTWGIVAVVVVLLATGGAYAYIRARSLAEQGALAHVKELFESAKYGELELYMEELRRTRPELANSPEVENIISQMKKIQEEAGAAKNDFDAIMRRLGGIRSSEYSDATVEQISQLLDDAELAARKLGGKSYMDKVTSWRNGWEDWRGRTLTDANNRLKAAVSAINAALDEKQRKPFADFEQEEAKLAELSQNAVSARAYLSYAADIEREKFADAQERLAGWEREFNERRTKAGKVSAELLELRKTIPAAVMQFSKYRDLLKRYVEIAPDNDALKSEYRAVLDNFKAYDGAVLRATLPGIVVPPDQNGADALEKQLGADGEFAGTVWEGDMQSALAYYRIHKNLKDNLGNLLNASPELFQLYYITYRRIGDTEWRRLYSQKPLVSGPHPADETVKIYWGNVYFAKEDDAVPVLTHTKNAFPDYLSTREFEIRMEDKKDDNICEYAKFLYRFMTEGADAPNMTVYVLNGIQKLYTDSKVEPVLRALLIKRLLALLNESFAGAQNGSLAEIVPELSAMSRRFARVSTDVPWMNAAHPDVIRACEEFEMAVKDMPDTQLIIDRLKNYGVVLETILNSGIRCVGAVCADAEGKLQLDLRGSAVSEIWGCFSQTAGAQPYFAVLSTDGKTFADPGLPCHVGMPVFSPAAGCELNAMLTQRGLDAEMLKELKKPQAWPMNSWK